MRRTVDDIVETLKNAKAHGRKCMLLIGAGCSVKAGIPTAAGFVEAIKNRYPSAYRRAEEKTYAQCMAELPVGQQRDLIISYVDKARINWAHIGIAQLMQHGFVDRVLTTNFDLLVARACALLGLFPAVYDFAASQVFNPADVPEQAVFYLHGQYTGFILINTEKEFEKHSGLLAPVFKDAGRGRVWLVVGYSGENDPVFDHLAQVPRFDQSLYWLGYLDNEPAKHVRERLLVDGKYAFYVNGFDADGFFITLAQRLNCFPPDLVCKPFSHLEEVLKLLTPYPIPAQDADIDWTENAHKLVRTAIERFEEVPRAEKGLLPEGISVTALVAQFYLMAGDYDKVVALRSEYDEGAAPELAAPLAWAYVMQGTALYDQAKTKAGEEADGLFAQAYEKYQAALEIKPDLHEALYNWGTALSDQAKTKAGEEADGLFAQAYEKYQAALEIKPDTHEVFYNWGNALSDQAKTKAGEEADRLFGLAYEKYQASLAIKPDKHKALNNWGIALYDQAKTKAGEEADRLFDLAYEKYQASLAIKPDMHDALNNWGSALYEQAKTKTGEEADGLFAQAYEKYQAAVEIKPDLHEALNNWGNALYEQTKTKAGEEADELFAQAYEKYQVALEIEPDLHEALNNWGTALSEQAKTKVGEEAGRLFVLAGEKYQAALEIKPDKHEALYNWGAALYEQAKAEVGEEADRLFALAYEKYQAALEIKPDKHEALNNWGIALSDQAKTKAGEEADRLFAEAKEKLLSAESISPGSSTYNLACLSALRGEEAECLRWLEKSRELGKLPPREHLANDPDLDNVRESEWFKAFLVGV